MLTLRNPAFSRRRAAVATAWRGVGEALTNWRRRVAASGAAELIIMAGLGGYHNTNGDRLSTRPCDRNPNDRGRIPQSTERPALPNLTGHLKFISQENSCTR